MPNMDIKHTLTSIIEADLDQNSFKKAREKISSVFDEIKVMVDADIDKKAIQESVDLLNKAFKKVGMPTIDVSELHKNLTKVRQDFEKVIASINNIDTSALKGIETSLERISTQVDKIVDKVGDGVKQSVNGAIASVTKLDKALSKIGDPRQKVEEAFNFSNNGSVKKQLNVLANLGDEWKKLENERIELSKKNKAEDIESWFQRQQAMVKYVKAYEDYYANLKHKKNVNKEYEGLYNTLFPKAFDAKTNLQNLSDRRSGTYSPQTEPWAKETTLKEVRNILKGGIKVSGDGTTKGSNEVGEKTTSEPKPPKKNTEKKQTNKPLSIDKQVKEFIKLYDNEMDKLGAKASEKEWSDLRTRMISELEKAFKIKDSTTSKSLSEQLTLYALDGDDDKLRNFLKKQIEAPMAKPQVNNVETQKEVVAINTETSAIEKQNKELKENIDLKQQGNNISDVAKETSNSVPVDSDAKVSIDTEALRGVLNSITYNVKVVHDTTDNNDNKMAIDEVALETTLNKVFANILNPQTSESPYASMPRDEATNYISDNYHHDMWDGWYSKALEPFRTQVAQVLENDIGLRNAALNQMWDEYKRINKTDIPYEEFLNTRIPLYRGEPTDSLSQPEKALSFSLSPEVAESFGENVLEVWMKPIDTLGMANPTHTPQPEGEVLIPKALVPEYTSWKQAISGFPEDSDVGNSNNEPLALESTLQTVKTVLDNIQTNTSKIEPQQPDGNTESLLTSIKTAIESIDKKIVRGTKTIIGGEDIDIAKKNKVADQRDNDIFEEKKATQKLSLAKFKTELETSGRLTEDVAKKIRGLAISLGMVKDSKGLTRWNERFKQEKLRAGIDVIENKDTVAADKQTEAEKVKLAKQYQELGVLEARSEAKQTEEAKVRLGQLQQEIAIKQDALHLSEQELEILQQIKAESKSDEFDVLGAKQSDKDIKKQLANAKKMAQREAMLGKAGNAVGRAENTWMNAAGIEAALPAEFNTEIDEYYKKLDDLRKKHQELKNSDIISEEQKADLIAQTLDVSKLTDEIGELIAEYQKLSGDNTNVIGTNALGRDSGLGAYEQQLKQAVMTATNGKAQIKGFDAATKTLAYTVKTGKNEFTEYSAAVRRADGALVSIQGSTKRTETFIEATMRKMKEISSYISGMSIISRVFQELKRGIQYVKEIDLALTELRKVTDETEEEYDEFLKTAAKTGSVIGSTIAEVTQATATFAKLGYSIEQATEMAESALVYQNVGDNIASVEDAADSIISTLKGFGLEASEAMRIVDRFNEVGNRFAITSQGIGEALRLSASALNEGGNSLDESIGLITAANEVVNDPSSVGTALKTLTLRLRGSKTELEEMGEDVTDMATTTSQLQAKLLALTGGQVNIMLDENTFKNSTQILREMAAAWEDMTDIERASALELMGGRLLPLYIEICA